jgi:hypothetical protein
VLTIAKLSRWSIGYYNDTARAAGQATKDACRANGGLVEYYSQHDTRATVWLSPGDAHQAGRVGGVERRGACGWGR